MRERHERAFDQSEQITYESHSREHMAHDRVFKRFESRDHTLGNPTSERIRVANCKVANLEVKIHLTRAISD